MRPGLCTHIGKSAHRAAEADTRTTSRTWQASRVMTGADTQMAMLPLSPAAAQEWGRQSLEGGWLLAQEVLDAYPLVSDAFVVAPMRFAEVTLTPETGQRISMRAADDFLDQVKSRLVV